MNPGDPVTVTYRNVPDGDTFMLIGLNPTGKGEPATGVSAPDFESMENTEMFEEPELPTYKKVPAESMASTVGAVPTGVRGVTSLSPPPGEIVNNETSPGESPVFAAYKNFLEGWITMDYTAAPAVIGLPASRVRMPELGSSRKTTIWLVPGRAAYKKRPLVTPPQLNHRPALAQTRNRAAAFFSIRDSWRNLKTTNWEIAGSAVAGDECIALKQYFS